MVRAFHEAGIEVWLDVVYNHTCEGDETGPTYSYRGIDDHSYYLSGTTGRYLDYTGCGNTTRCAHPLARLLVLRQRAALGGAYGRGRVSFRSGIGLRRAMKMAASIHESPAIATEFDRGGADV